MMLSEFLILSSCSFLREFTGTLIFDVLFSSCYLRARSAQSSKFLVSGVRLLFLNTSSMIETTILNSRMSMRS